MGENGNIKQSHMLLSIDVFNWIAASTKQSPRGDKRGGELLRRLNNLLEVTNRDTVSRHVRTGKTELSSFFFLSPRKWESNFTFLLHNNQ